jgi:hypothetical protein
LQQLIGGPSRRMGILLATGLLLGGPLAGWAVLAGIVLRILWERLAGLVRLPKRYQPFGKRPGEWGGSFAVSSRQRSKAS